MSKKQNIIIAASSAILGGLGVGYLTVGPMADASRPAIVADDNSTDTGSSTGGSTDTPTPPADDQLAPDAPDAPGDHLAEVLAPLVTDGTITQAQADKVIEALKNARPDGGRGMRGPRGMFKKEALTVAAGVLGLTEDELRTELQGGKTLAEVATAKNVDVQKVIDALVADATQHIDQAVTDGKITADQATKAKENLVERTTKFVNEGPQRGPRGPRGPHMDDQQPPADAPSDDQGN